jgi:hypothetical protein
MDATDAEEARASSPMASLVRSQKKIHQPGFETRCTARNPDLSGISTQGKSLRLVD